LPTRARGKGKEGALLPVARGDLEILRTPKEQEEEDLEKRKRPQQSRREVQFRARQWKKARRELHAKGGKDVLTKAKF